jgi:hypothetical protein
MYQAPRVLQVIKVRFDQCQEYRSFLLRHRRFNQNGSWARDFDLRFLTGFGAVDVCGWMVVGQNTDFESPDYRQYRWHPSHYT